MNTYLLDDRLRTGLGIALLLSAVWLVAAAFRPTATFHLAPILIAGAVPILGRGATVPRQTIIVATLIGAAVATLAAVILTAFDLLRGPTLLPYGGAFAEAISFALLGAAVGLLVLIALPRSTD